MYHILYPRLYIVTIFSDLGSDDKFTPLHSLQLRSNSKLVLYIILSLSLTHTPTLSTTTCYKQGVCLLWLHPDLMVNCLNIKKSNLVGCRNNRQKLCAMIDIKLFFSVILWRIGIEEVQFILTSNKSSVLFTMRRKLQKLRSRGL